MARPKMFVASMLGRGEAQGNHVMKSNKTNSKSDSRHLEVRLEKKSSSMEGGSDSIKSESDGEDSARSNQELASNKGVNSCVMSQRMLKIEKKRPSLELEQHVDVNLDSELSAKQTDSTLTPPVAMVYRKQNDKLWEITTRTSNSSGDSNACNHQSDEEALDVDKAKDCTIKSMKSKPPIIPSLQKVCETHGKMSYPQVLELKDDKGVNFYAYEDKDMIRWLGKEKFIKVLQFAPFGWVKTLFGGDEGNLRLYKCTMTYTRYKCICIYTEPEYEELMLEAHCNSRQNYLAKRSKSASSRPPFQCVHCNTNFKDKNAVSWHRMRNVCSKYKGKKFLKMYPTWGKSHMSELKRIKMKLEKKIEPIQIQTKRKMEKENKTKEKKMKYTPVEGETSKCLKQHSHEKVQEDTTHSSKILPMLQKNNTKDTMQGQKVMLKSKPSQSTPQTRSMSHKKLAKETVKDKTIASPVSKNKHTQKDTTEAQQVEATFLATMDLVKDMQNIKNKVTQLALHQKKLTTLPKTRIGIKALVNMKAKKSILPPQKRRKHIVQEDIYSKDDVVVTMSKKEISSKKDYNCNYNSMAEDKDDNKEVGNVEEEASLPSHHVEMQEMDSSDKKEPLVDRGTKHKRGPIIARSPTKLACAGPSMQDYPTLGGSYFTWSWVPGHYVPYVLTPPTWLAPPPPPYPRVWQEVLYGGSQEGQDQLSRPKRKEAYNSGSRKCANLGGKAHWVYISETGEVDPRCEGKNAWDEALRRLVPKILDMSVVEWMKQKPQAVKKLRDTIDREFEYLGHPLSMLGFRQSITRYLKSERSRLKLRWLKGQKACPVHIKDEKQWDRLMAYWQTPAQQLKAQKMAIARQSVKNFMQVGEKARPTKKHRW